jgi:alpha-tubulin suppressor-like RCC1 family protein
MKSIRTLSQICLLAAALLSACGAMAQNYAAWPVTQIAAGANHSLFTKSDGTVYVMGDNTDGQLGLGSSVTNVNVPRQLTNGVSLIAAGSAHSLLVRGRTLLAMGLNSYGQLGDGTTNNHYVPELVATVLFGSEITAVAAGANHSLFVTKVQNSVGGGLYAMGWNYYGQLGDNSYTDHHAPEEIFTNSPGSPIVTAVAAGYGHSLFIKSDASLWGMGDDSIWQLGTYWWPFGPAIQTTNKPVEVFPDGVSTVVAAGSDYSLFTDTDGGLYSIGDNQFGQLGNPIDPYEYQAVQYPNATAGPPPLFLGPEYTTNTVVAVAAGYTHSLFLLSDGSLWDMGDNNSGQLGVGFAGYYTDVFQEIETNDVVAVAAGRDYSLFIKSDGTLWGMGYNANGELGTGDYTEHDTPVEIVSPPPQISIASYGANVILAWTANSAGFILQSTPDLASPVWTTVSPGPVLVGDQFVAFAPGSGTQKFYRLMLNQ